MQDDWLGYKIPKRNRSEDLVDTTVSAEILASIGHQISTLPQGKRFLKKIAKLFEDREQMVRGGQLDWGISELLAYGTIIGGGVSV